MVTANKGERATLSVEEAAAIIGISRTFAYEMAKTGNLPVIRMGRRMLVPRAALERMLAGEPTSTELPNEAA